VATPVRVVGLGDGRALRDPRVVDEDVRLLPVSIVNGEEKLCHVIRVRYVANVVHHVHTKLLSDFVCHRFDFAARARAQGDIRALARKGERDGASDAATAAGDECGFTFQLQVSSPASLRFEIYLLKRGARFSKKARTPSRASVV
jgi:hypothetical protein